MFLSSFPAVYSELLKLFDVREVANLVQDTLGSLPTIVHVDDSLQAVKLQCIGKTVESQLYTNPGRVLSLSNETLFLKSYHLLLIVNRSAEAIRKRKQNYFPRSIVYLSGRINLLSSQTEQSGY